jgi:hypothetical protein
VSRQKDASQGTESGEHEEWHYSGLGRKGKLRIRVEVAHMACALLLSSWLRVRARLGNGVRKANPGSPASGVPLVVLVMVVVMVLSLPPPPPPPLLEKCPKLVPPHPIYYHIVYILYVAG